MTISRSIGLLAVWAGLAGVPAFGQTWDATADYSATQNPNGAWRYGWSTALPGPLTIYPNADVTNIGGERWVDYSIMALGTPSVVHYGPSSTGQCSPPGLTMHPGPQNQFSHCLWTAPVSGTYSIQASFTALDTGGPHGYVLKNGNAIGESLLREGVEKDYSFSAVAMAAGDTIDVATGVGVDGVFYCDTTHFSLTITALGSGSGAAPPASPDAVVSHNNDSRGVEPTITQLGAPGAASSVKHPASTAGDLPDAGNLSLPSTTGTGPATEHYAAAISGALSTEVTSGSNSTFKTIPISDAAILKAIVLSDTTGTLRASSLDIAFDPLNFDLDVIDKATHQAVLTIGEQGANFSKVTEVATTSNSGENATLCYTGYEVFFPGLTNAVQSLTLVFHASKANAPVYDPASSFNISFVGGSDSPPQQFIQGFIRKDKATYRY
jgi:hypothetical protein